MRTRECAVDEEVRRDSTFEAVATCIPSIFSYVVSAYETPSSLIYGTYT